MIPLTLRDDYVPGMISAPVPSRRRSRMLAESVGSLRDTAAHPELVEILVAYDPDDPETGDTARDLGALAWCAPERYGFAGQSRYYAHLIGQARGEWLFPTWSDDAVMETPGWDDLLRAQPAGTVAYIDGNCPGLTAFPAVHRDALKAIGRLSALPWLDTWFEEVARAAGKLTVPGIYVRQDRVDLNGLNDDETHREGGAAWRAAHRNPYKEYLREPHAGYRAEDAARLRAGCLG